MNFPINLCRLCLTEKCFEDFVNISSRNREESIRFSSILTKHFWFLIVDLRAGDTFGRVCQNCWLKTIDFHSFYTVIEKAQNDFALRGRTIIKSEIEHESDFRLLSDPQCGFDWTPTIAEIKEDFSDGGVNSSEYDGQSLKDDKSKLLQRQRQKKSEDDNKKQDALPNYKKTVTNRKTLCKTEFDHQIREYFKMECDICAIKFETFADAQTHYRTMHDQPGYLTCCAQKFQHRRSIIEHVRRHVNPFNRFKCDHCHRTYGKKSGLKYHILSIHGPKDLRKFECKQCSNRFFTKAKLESHVLLRHSTEADKKFACDKCDKKFLTNSLLNVHVRNLHDMLYTQICDLCAKVFKDKNGLSQHKINVHSTVELPRFKCELCDRWLKNKKGLKIHMTHHMDTPKECNICHKSYPNNHTLDSHIRNVHTGRNYPCQMCTKAFKKAVHLKEHMATHTGEDIYTCLYCPQTFKSSGNMYQHRKKQHQDKMLKAANKFVKYASREHHMIDSE